MSPKLLLFDIDGTMLLTGGAGMRAMRTVANQMFGQQFSWEGIDPGGNLDPMIFATAIQNNGFEYHKQLHENFREKYLTQLADELKINFHDIEIMAGIKELITILRQRIDTAGDLVLGLLTGNYGAAAELKLNAIDIDVAWFPITAFGDEAATRPDLVALAIKRYQQTYSSEMAPSDVIIIGDTPRDIDCAKAHGCVSFAVATGHWSVEQLLEHRPDVVVEDLSDPIPLLKLLKKNR